jgi:hypothetical protein
MIFFNFKLPEDLDYISLCVAVMAECILFKFHFFGHHEGLSTNPIDTKINLKVGSIGNPFIVNVALDTNIELLF